MSIKIAHQKEQAPSHASSKFMQSPMADSFNDAMMLTPQSKRYLRDPWANDSLFSSNELFLPTEMEKLKKLFPLLDSKVRVYLKP